jgi:hypothetical protein
MSQPYADQIDTVQLAAPARAIAPPTASAALLILGGLLMMLMYVGDVIHTLATGHMVAREEALITWQAALHNLAFNGCLLLVGAGLLTLSLALRPRAPWLASAGLVFAALAAGAAATNIGMLVARLVPSGGLGGVGVIANLAASAFLGGAALRSTALPRRIGMILLITGVITFPAILLTFPLGMILPEFVVADLPFLCLGAVFSSLGLLLRSAQNS